MALYCVSLLCLAFTFSINVKGERVKYDAVLGMDIIRQGDLGTALRQLVFIYEQLAASYVDLMNGFANVLQSNGGGRSLDANDQNVILVFRKSPSNYNNK